MQQSVLTRIDNLDMSFSSFHTILYSIPLMDLVNVLCTKKWYVNNFVLYSSKEVRLPQ
jgi:hypothetical protein